MLISGETWAKNQNYLALHFYRLLNQITLGIASFCWLSRVINVICQTSQTTDSCNHYDWCWEFKCILTSQANFKSSTFRGGCMQSPYYPHATHISEWVGSKPIFRAGFMQSPNNPCFTGDYIQPITNSSHKGLHVVLMQHPFQRGSMQPLTMPFSQGIPWSQYTIPILEGVCTPPWNTHSRQFCVQPPLHRGWM